MKRVEKTFEGKESFLGREEVIYDGCLLERYRTELCMVQERTVRMLTYAETQAAWCFREQRA